jgi:hypothetical protein
MKEFMPSPDFVKNTMEAIRAIEVKKPQLSWEATIRSIAGYAGAAGALIIGIINLLRFIATVYAPIGCH